MSPFGSNLAGPTRTGGLWPGAGPQSLPSMTPESRPGGEPPDVEADWLWRTLADALATHGQAEHDGVRYAFDPDQGAVSIRWDQRPARVPSHEDVARLAARVQAGAPLRSLSSTDLTTPSSALMTWPAAPGQEPRG